MHEWRRHVNMDAYRWRTETYLALTQKGKVIVLSQALQGQEKVTQKNSSI